MGLAVTSEWMFAPELASGVVQRILPDWKLPTIDLWAVFPTGRLASAKARAFADFIGTYFESAAGLRRTGWVMSPSLTKGRSNAPDPEGSR